MAKTKKVVSYTNSLSAYLAWLRNTERLTAEEIKTLEILVQTEIDEAVFEEGLLNEGC